MSIRKHILKHINETNLINLDDEISFDQSENTINKAANDVYLNMLYDFKNCKEGDLLYYHNELGFNLVEGRKEFGDVIHIYGRCIIPYDGHSVTFTFLPYLDYPSEKTWYAHIRSGNFWSRQIYNHVDNPNYKFSIRMASYDIFEKIFMDQTGLLNRGEFPDDSEFAVLPLIRKYGEDNYWCDQENQENTKEALLLTPCEIYTGYKSYKKQIYYKYVPKSEKFNAIYTIKFTFPKIRKSLLKESIDFNSLLQIDNDIEFEQSRNSAQKVTKNIKEWRFVQENFVDLDLPSGTLWGKHNLGATCGRTQTSWYGKYYSWGELKSKKLFSPDRYSYKKEVDILPLTNDAAFHYNDKCSIPTVELFNELIKNTKHKWIHNYNDVEDLNGYLLTGKNGNSIFIPASGVRADAASQEKTSVPFNAGQVCMLWSANSTRRKGFACDLYGDNSDSLNVDDYSEKWEGLCIRPVMRQ